MKFAFDLDKEQLRPPYLLPLLHSQPPPQCALLPALSSVIAHYQAHDLMQDSDLTSAWGKVTPPYDVLEAW